MFTTTFMTAPSDKIAHRDSHMEVRGNVRSRTMNAESMRTEALYAHGLQFRDSVYIGIGAGEVTLTDTAVFGDRGISIGSGARALSTDSIAIGTNAEVLNGAARAIIVGSNTTVSAIPKLVGTRVNTGADGVMTDIEAAEDFAVNGTYVLYFTSSGAGAAYELYYPMVFVQAATVAEVTLTMEAVDVLITSNFQVGTYRVTYTFSASDGPLYTLTDPSSVVVTSNISGVFSTELKFAVSVNTLSLLTSGDFLEITVPTPVVVGTGTAGGGTIESDHFSFSITDGATPFAADDLMYIFFSDEFTAQAIMIGATNAINSDSASAVITGADNTLNTFNDSALVLGNSNTLGHACANTIVIGNNNDLPALVSSTIIIGNDSDLAYYYVDLEDPSSNINCVIIGNESKAVVESIAVGLGVRSSMRGVALGSYAHANNGGISIGVSSQSIQGVALGARAVGNGYESIAIGNDSTGAIAGIAIGARSEAYNQDIAIGLDAVCTTTDFLTQSNGIAIGSGATINTGIGDANCISLGAGAASSGTCAMAIGAAASATDNQLQINLSGAAAAPGAGVLTTKLLSSATPATGPTAGAADAIPGAPTSWLAVTLGTTNYLIPMWAGAL